MLELNATHVSTQSFGTVPYMPPELLSQGRMTKAVDVYSFAVLSAPTTPPPPFTHARTHAHHMYHPSTISKS